MDNNKVLYVAQEIIPYLPATPQATRGQKIPVGIQEQGFEVRTFMPKYGCINERRNQLHEVIRLSGMNLIIDDTDHPLIIKVATLQPSRMQVYFIDNDDYFQRHGASDLETRLSPEDNDERMIFFVRGVVETVKKLRWEPAVVHCSGWLTSLVPLYLKTMFHDDPSFRSSKIVFALGDDPLQGTLDPRMVEKLRMDRFTQDDLATLGADPVDYITLSKIAIDYADGIAQETPDADPELIAYAQEKGKPFLPYPGDDALLPKALRDFYETL